MSLALRTHILDKLREQHFISAPMIVAQRNFSLQYVGRVLNEMVVDHKLKLVGKIGTAKYYVLPRSQMTLDKIEASLANRDLTPTAWMGGIRTPTEFMTLLDPDKQATARKLLDSTDPEYYNYFTEILPAVETLCYGRRASTELDLDIARAKVAVFSARMDAISQFLRLFLENEHIKSGSFAEALSDYSINMFRDGYTREEAS